MTLLRGLIGRKSKAAETQAEQVSVTEANGKSAGATGKDEASDQDLKLTLTQLQNRLREPDASTPDNMETPDKAETPDKVTRKSAAGGEPGTRNSPASAAERDMAARAPRTRQDDNRKIPDPAEIVARVSAASTASREPGTRRREAPRTRPGLADLPDRRPADPARYANDELKSARLRSALRERPVDTSEGLSGEEADELEMLEAQKAAETVPPRTPARAATPMQAPETAPEPAATLAPMHSQPLQAADRPEPGPVQVPAPSAGRSGARAGRAKTRLLGFENSHETDPFNDTESPSVQPSQKFPVGWIVVVKGPGLGAHFPVFGGVSQIGRGEDQTVRLNFGDNSISRNNHAAIAYDSEQRSFFLGHGGKANLVRLNNNPVLSTETISNNDLIRIGETTLRFVALCGEDFDWNAEDQKDNNVAAII